VDWDRSDNVQSNEVLEAYYWDQDFVQPSEWQSFMQHFRAPLPTSFRITSGKPSTKILLRQMREHYLPFLSDVIFEGEPIPAPKAMPWYPESMAWQIDVKKNALRKTEQFKKFQHFLVHETEVGNISRQETVSMIPPLFLDVQPHHIVLDMCAAPGSKTAQLIEALHSPLTSSADAYDPCPPGMVIANDSDAKRAHMLVHQSSRLPSPNIVVANCDASRWPAVRVPWMAEGSGHVQERTLKFDRILADVPCSGDGTLRKNRMIWKDWHPHNAAALHPLQLRILLRGLHNLRSGGRLVYSTCSLNPLENEAVVAEALRQFNGSVKLVDQSAAFTELVRRPGLKHWKVCPTKGKQKLGKKKEDKNVEASSDAVKGEGSTEVSENAFDPLTYREKLPTLPYVDTYEELSDELKEKLPRSLWPQGDGQELNLDRCMRVCPHDQNTGGFFVAVLEKDDGTDMEIAEGMALGMVRAMAKKDANKETTSSSDSATAKRTLSPALEEPASKRLKADAVADDAFVSGTVTPLPVGDDAISGGEASAADDKRQEVGTPGGAPYREDPMVYVDRSDAQIQSIVSFFGLSNKFDDRNLLVRNKDALPLRSVYLTSTSVRALITCGGAGRGDHPYGNPLKLRLINCGVRAFARQESGKDPKLKCKWRVTSDAIAVLRPLVEPTKVISGTVEDFSFLTSNHYPKLGDIPQGQFRTAVEALDTGSHLVDIRPGTFGEHKLERVLCVPIWRAPASLNLMLERQEKSALSYRIFGRDLSNPSGDRQFGQTRAQNLAQQQANQKKRGGRGGPDGSNADDTLDEDALQEMENAAAAAAAAPEHTTSQATTSAVQEEGQVLPVE
jgi:multisite-specific tRNA:(cytosine-C5)-methyltransferase